MESIYVTRPSMPAFEEYCDEIRDLWDSRWLTNMGAKHEEFQKKLEEFFRVPHVTLFANGHLALESAIEAFRFPAGSEVITTPFTFASTTHAIVRCGLVPVFCDIRPDTLTMDASKIESLITSRTAAILPVHVYGNMCDVDAIAKIAEKHRLKVIYDAAHAFGVRLRGISAACFGDVSVFSFHATKVFQTIEGGAACYREDALEQILDDLKNYGIRDEAVVAAVGGNAKMNEFQAAMGICNLRHFDREIAGRKSAYERYRERLGGISGLILPGPQEETEPNYSYFPVLFDGFKYTRDEAAQRLAREGIFARKYFYPLTSEYDCYRNPRALRTGTHQGSGEKNLQSDARMLRAGALRGSGDGNLQSDTRMLRAGALQGSGEKNLQSDARMLKTGDTPVAAKAARQVLTLPLYADLSPGQVDRICGILLR